MSGVEEVQSVKAPHKRQQSVGNNLQSTNALQKVAKVIEKDKKVKNIEDKILEKRQDSIKQLNAIKNYLKSVKTADKYEKAYKSLSHSTSVKMESKGLIF